MGEIFHAMKNSMTKPPLYSRNGNISPTFGSKSSMAIDQGMALGGIGQNGEVIGENTTPGESLLEKAQKFSIFCVQQVEEARQALIRTADTRSWTNYESGKGFGGKNGTEITAAFEELTAAYGKLSSLKWDAARVEFEDGHRIQVGLATHYSKSPIRSNDGNVETRVKIMPITNAEEVIMESRGVKDHPWQDDEINPHDWIADAFLKRAISSEDEDEGGDSFPVNGHLASLNATAEPFPTNSLTTKTASTPPGFQSEPDVQKVELNDAEDQQGDDYPETKPTMRSLTSISSEISSLHTNSHVNTDDDDTHDDQDSDSEYSDTSSSSEETPPSMENFDYLYKGGYAMQVSGGKETKGVVPKTVKRVLVDSSVKSIEEGAFQGCNVLETVTIPSTVEAVGDQAFRKCSKLKNVVFLTKGPKSRRRGQTWNQKRDEKKEEKQSYGRSASAPSSMTEPRSSQLRTIGEWAFFNCSSLVNVKLPYGLVSIGTRAFQRCSSMSLDSDELPKSLMSVGENAFFGCPPQTKAAFERWEKEQFN